LISVTRRPAAGPEPDKVLWDHHWRDPDGCVTLSLARQGDAYLLHFPDQCQFLVSPRSARIEVLADLDFPDDSLEHLLVDQVLPRLLAHDGALMLHASAVSTDDGVLLFLGKTGHGKSTLAGLLHARGRALLSDDCVMIDQGTDPVEVLPTYPSLRLYEDSVLEAFPEWPTTTSVAQYSDKYRVMPPPGFPDAAPARVMYLLEDPANHADGCRISPLPQAAACMALVQHAFQLDPADMQCAARTLAACSALARRLPMYSLAYPRDFSRSDETTSAILAHAGQLRLSPG
jgi:hypothetical protein